MINQSATTVLLLLKRALFNADVKLGDKIDWSKIYEESVSQSILPLIYNCLTNEEKETMPQEISVKWQKAFFSYIAKNTQLVYEQKQILETLKKNDVSCAVMKGSSCAANYPNPNLRVMGDIDILVLPNEQQKAVEILQRNGYGNAFDQDNVCHLSVSKNNITVEIHREPNGLFINKDPKLKERFDLFFKDALKKIEIDNDIPMLSDIYQAIVLILHKLGHFLTGGLGLRQLCDWALFIKNKMNDELWRKLEILFKDFGLFTFTVVITKVCVDNLGLPLECAVWCNDCDDDLSNQMIEHIIKSGSFGVKDSAYGERFFVDAHSKNRISSFFKVLISACYHHWPICKKYKILMPIAPFVIYFKYLKLRKAKKRDKLQPIKLYKRAGTKQHLYYELKPFVIDNNK